jgi:hypothetical protein
MVSSVPYLALKGALVILQGFPLCLIFLFCLSEVNSLDDHLCCTSSHHMLCILIVLNCTVHPSATTSFVCVLDPSFRIALLHKC